MGGLPATVCPGNDWQWACFRWIIVVFVKEVFAQSRARFGAPAHLAHARFLCFVFLNYQYGTASESQRVPRVRIAATASQY